MFSWYIFYSHCHRHRWMCEDALNHRMWKSGFDSGHFDHILLLYSSLNVFPDKGLLHKSLVLEGEVHTVEEIQLLKNTESVKTLLLSSQAVRTARLISSSLETRWDPLWFLTCRVFCPSQGRFLYAGGDSGVVQSPTAFCEKYLSCVDCVLARDPYCAWDPRLTSCVNIFQHDADPRWEMRTCVHYFTFYSLIAFCTHIIHYNTGVLCSVYGTELN